VLEARLPLGPGNTELHHGYPFGVVIVAAILLTVGIRTARARPDSRWARRTALTGLGYSINGALIAGLSYGVTPEGAHFPVRAVGWTEDWFFLFPDMLLIGLLVGALPNGRLRWPAKLLVGFSVVTGALNVFVPRMLDNSHIANPTGIEALKPLTGLAAGLIGVAFILAAVLSLGRSIQLAVRSRREHLGYGRQALAAGITIIVTLFAQGAFPETTLWGPFVTFALGTLVAAPLAARVVLTSSADAKVQVTA
jgi:hypothetical protein